MLDRRSSMITSGSPLSVLRRQTSEFYWTFLLSSILYDVLKRESYGGKCLLQQYQDPKLIKRRDFLVICRGPQPGVAKPVGDVPHLRAHAFHGDRDPNCRGGEPQRPPRLSAHDGPQRERVLAELAPMLARI